MGFADETSVPPPGWREPAVPRAQQPVGSLGGGARVAADAAVRGRVNAAIADQLLLGVAALVAGALLSPAMGVGVAVALLVAGWLACATLFEAATGQTPGKRWAGVRVVRHDGGPISVGQALVRNVARLLDALPVLYASGLITMLVTGRRRQRIGDVLAGTQVVPVDGGARTPRSPRALLPVLAAVAVLVSVAVLAGEGRSARGRTGGGDEAFARCVTSRLPSAASASSAQFDALAAALRQDPATSPLPRRVHALLQPCLR
jgi:uncharacterized RDD family membrane protein YckC